MVPIILDGWLLEIGHINRDFGHDIAEWSIEIIPPAFVMLAVGALVATNVALLLRFPSSCASAVPSTPRSAMVSNGSKSTSLRHRYRRTFALGPAHGEVDSAPLC